MTKKFQCKVCGRFLKKKQYLVRHMKTQHQEPKSVKCDLCAKTFNSAGAQFMHKLRKH